MRFVEEYKDHPTRIGQFSSVGGPHITIRKDLTHESKVETLFHELGHALMWRLGMSNTAMPNDIEEIIVEGFANFIMEDLL